MWSFLFVRLLVVRSACDAMQVNLMVRGLLMLVVEETVSHRFDIVHVALDRVQVITSFKLNDKRLKLKVKVKEREREQQRSWSLLFWRSFCELCP